MKIYVLFGQRKEQYPGEYAPEALEVMDEYGVDENGQWLLGKKKEYEEDGTMEFTKIVPVEIDDAAFKDYFFQEKALEGKIANN